MRRENYVAFKSSLARMNHPTNWLTLRCGVVDSTNELAKRLLRTGLTGSDILVTARGQTAGKGTRGRQWLSPVDAGLYMSYLCRPPRNAGHAETGRFTLAAGVACAEVLRALGSHVELKPINDLVLGERKLAGILTEALWEAGRIYAVIVGVGLNVRAAPRGAIPAVSLEESMPPEAFSRVNPNVLAAALTLAIRSWFYRLADDAQAIQRAWLRFAIPGAGFPAPGEQIGPPARL